MSPTTTVQRVGCLLVALLVATVAGCTDDPPIHVPTLPTTPPATQTPTTPPRALPPCTRIVSAVPATAVAAAAAVPDGSAEDDKEDYSSRFCAVTGRVGAAASWARVFIFVWRPSDPHLGVSRTQALAGRAESHVDFHCEKPAQPDDLLTPPPSAGAMYRCYRTANDPAGIAVAAVTTQDTLVAVDITVYHRPGDQNIRREATEAAAAVVNHVATVV